MKTKRTLTITIAVVAFAILATFGIFHNTKPVQAQSQTPPPVGDRISFGTVGITAGQTMRVNVSNIIATNDSGFPPGLTRVAIIVINTTAGGNCFAIEAARLSAKWLTLNAAIQLFLT